MIEHKEIHGPLVKALSRVHTARDNDFHKIAENRESWAPERKYVRLFLCSKNLKVFIVSEKIIVGTYLILIGLSIHKQHIRYVLKVYKTFLQPTF